LRLSRHAAHPHTRLPPVAATIMPYRGQRQRKPRPRQPRGAPRAACFQSIERVLTRFSPRTRELKKTHHVQEGLARPRRQVRAGRAARRRVRAAWRNSMRTAACRGAARHRQASGAGTRPARPRIFTPHFGSTPGSLELWAPAVARGAGRLGV